jgi:hypothetical protein
VSLLVVHDLERKASKAAAALYLQATERDESRAPDTDDTFTQAPIIRWKDYRAPQSALLAYRQNLPGDDTAETVTLGDATSLAVYPWSDYVVPRAARLWQGLPADGDAPPPADSPGDATALTVVAWKPWDALSRWSGLYQNTAQDDSGGTFEYGLQSDMVIEYDARLYSPMSRWLYQMSPAQDETSADVPGEPGDATSLMVYAFHPQATSQAALLARQWHSTGDQSVDGEVDLGNPSKNRLLPLMGVGL